MAMDTAMELIKDPTHRPRSLQFLQLARNTEAASTGMQAATATSTGMPTRVVPRNALTLLLMRRVRKQAATATSTDMPTRAVPSNAPTPFLMHRFHKQAATATSTDMPTRAVPSNAPTMGNPICDTLPTTIMATRTVVATTRNTRTTVPNGIRKRVYLSTNPLKTF